MVIKPNSTIKNQELFLFVIKKTDIIYRMLPMNVAIQLEYGRLADEAYFIVTRLLNAFTAQKNVSKAFVTSQFDKLDRKLRTLNLELSMLTQLIQIDLVKSPVLFIRPDSNLFNFIYMSIKTLEAVCHILSRGEKLDVSKIVSHFLEKKSELLNHKD